jgi:hypothetical protein
VTRDSQQFEPLQAHTCGAAAAKVTKAPTKANPIAIDFFMTVSINTSASVGPV